MPVTWRAYIDSRTAQMEEEIKALKRKSIIGEIGLKATEERCHLLEKNVRLVQIFLTVNCCQPGRKECSPHGLHHITLQGAITPDRIYKMVGFPVDGNLELRRNLLPYFVRLPFRMLKSPPLSEVYNILL